MKVKEESLDEEEPKIDMEKQSKLINKILVGLIIIIILATVFLIYYQKVKYNEFYFDYNDYSIHKVKQGNIYVYQIEVILDKGVKNKLTVRYDPRELELIPFDSSVLDNVLSKKEIFITMPSNATGISVLAATEVGKITGNPYLLKNPIPTHGALVEPIEGKDVEVKTCDDVSSDISIIELRPSDENKIYSEKDCVILEGKSEYAFIKLANRLTLGLIGIME